MVSTRNSLRRRASKAKSLEESSSSSKEIISTQNIDMSAPTKRFKNVSSNPFSGLKILLLLSFVGLAFCAPLDSGSGLYGGSSQVNMQADPFRGSQSGETQQNPLFDGPESNMLTKEQKKEQKKLKDQANKKMNKNDPNKLVSLDFSRERVFSSGIDDNELTTSYYKYAVDYVNTNTALKSLADEGCVVTRKQNNMIYIDCNHMNGIYVDSVDKLTKNLKKWADSFPICDSEPVVYPCGLADESGRRVDPSGPVPSAVYSKTSFNCPLKASYLHGTDIVVRLNVHMNCYANELKVPRRFISALQATYQKAIPLGPFFFGSNTSNKIQPRGNIRNKAYAFFTNIFHPQKKPAKPEPAKSTPNPIEMEATQNRIDRARASGDYNSVENDNNAYMGGNSANDFGRFDQPIGSGGFDQPIGTGGNRAGGYGSGYGSGGYGAGGYGAGGYGSSFSNSDVYDEYQPIGAYDEPNSYNTFGSGVYKREDEEVEDGYADDEMEKPKKKRTKQKKSRKGRKTKKSRSRRNTEEEEQAEEPEYRNDRTYEEEYDESEY